MPKKKQGGRDFFLYGHEGQRENNLFVRDYASTTDSARIAKTSPHDQSDLWRGFSNISYTWEVCGIQAIEKKLPESRAPLDSCLMGILREVQCSASES